MSNFAIIRTNVFYLARVKAALVKEMEDVISRCRDVRILRKVYEEQLQHFLEKLTPVRKEIEQAQILSTEEGRAFFDRMYQDFTNALDAAFVAGTGKKPEEHKAELEAAAKWEKEQLSNLLKEIIRVGPSVLEVVKTNQA